VSSILITGVSSGIGGACARKFASEGWHVVGTVRNPSRASMPSMPSGVHLEQLDLSVAGSATRLGEAVLERFGCPDVVLNNAGMVQFGPLEDISSEALERIFQVNVFGQLELVQALLPSMRSRGSGVIANVTSLGGRVVFPFFAGYNATKWALEGVSEGLWHELKPFGIRVKAIEPGFVETAIWGKALPDDDSGPPAQEAYRPYVKAMRRFGSSISARTSTADAAVAVWRAINDPSDRLRYPIAAYAAPIVALRRVLGDQAFMRFFHSRWLG